MNRSSVPVSLTRKTGGWGSAESMGIEVNIRAFVVNNKAFATGDSP